MPQRVRAQITEDLAERCRKLVFATAEEYGIPPVHITAHITTKPANAARFKVWDVMISEWGLARGLVARIFNRDLRRVRAGVVSTRTEAYRHIRRVPRPIPTVVVGRQVVWCFAAPSAGQEPPKARKEESALITAIRHVRAMRQIPPELLVRLNATEREALRRQIVALLAGL